MKKLILFLSALILSTFVLYSQVQIVNFNKENTFRGEWIKDILVNPDGEIWFADDTGNGIYIYKDQQWTHLSADQGFPENVKTLARDLSGNIWIGTSNGLFRYNGTDITVFSTTDGLISNDVNDILTDAGNNVFIATSSGLSILSPAGIWNSLTESEGLVNNFINELLFDTQLNLWIATAGGLSKYDGSFTNYTTTDGLIHNNVKAIAQDQSGTMWFGTLNGVSAYNGTTWTNYGTANGLSNNDISDILADSKGNIWFASYTPNGGITKYDGLNWPTYTTEHGLINNNTESLAEDLQGNIWIGTGAGISQLAPDSWGYYSILNGLPDNTIFDLITDPSGNKWIATNNGLSKYDGSFINFSSANGLPGNNCRTLVLDSSGDIWAGTLNGAAKYQSEQWMIYNTDSGLVNNDVYDIIPQDESLWFVTSGGLSLYDGNDFVHYTVSDGLASNNNYHGILDSDGNIWVGSMDNGVSMFDGSAWTVFNTGNGFLHNTVWDILEDKDHNIWFATGGGVAKFDGTNWHTVTRADGLPATAVISLEQDDNGILWFGTDSSQIVLYNGTLFRSYSLAHKIPDVKTHVIREMNDTMYAGGDMGLVTYSYKTAWTNYSKSSMPGDTIEAVYFDSAQRLWAGSWGNGIGIYSGNKWAVINQSDGLAGNYIYDITEDSENNIWVISTEGVSRITENTINTFDNGDGLAGTGYYSAAADAAGNVWIGSNAGVSVYNGSSFTNYSTTDGLPGDHVTAIWCKAENQVWIGTVTGNGAAFYNGSTWTVYGTDQGLVNNNVYDITGDKNGNIWFATLGGISMFDGKAFTNYPSSVYFGNTGLWAVKEDTMGMLWACSWGGGAYVFNGKSWNQLNQEKGIAGNDVRDITLQQNGTVWLATYGGGLSRIIRATCRFDSLTIQGVSCYDSSDAIITIYPDIVEMTYSLDGIMFDADNEFHNLGPGLYFPVVTNGFDTLFADPVLLSSPPPVFVSLGNDTAICQGVSVTLSVPPSSSVIWSNGIENESEIIITESGIYSVIVYDQDGCAGKDTVAVVVNPLPEFNLGEDKTVYSDDLTPLTLDPDIDNVTYQWNTGETTRTVVIDASVIPEGVYTYTLTVKDENGCIFIDSCLVTVVVEQGLDVKTNDILKLYPNPSTGKLYLEISNIGNIKSIEIVNEQGQVMHIIQPEKLTSKYIIDISGYPDGFYYIHLHTKKKTVVLKTVLNK